MKVSAKFLWILFTVIACLLGIVYFSILLDTICSFGKVEARVYPEGYTVAASAELEDTGIIRLLDEELQIACYYNPTIGISCIGYTPKGSPK